MTVRRPGIFQQLNTALRQAPDDTQKVKWRTSIAQSGGVAQRAGSSGAQGLEG